MYDASLHLNCLEASNMQAYTRFSLGKSKKKLKKIFKSKQVTDETSVSKS